MKLLGASKPFLVAFVFTLGLWHGLSAVALGQKSAVNFQTEDGWKLSGTLYMPKQRAGAPMPAVVLLTEPGWVDRSIYDSYLAQDLADKGFVALNVDLRGTGGSLGKKVFEQFTAKEKDGIQLDARAAIEYLASQSSVDASRIAIVGAGLSANYAVLEAADNSRVQGLVLISGSVGRAGREYLQSEGSVPVLGVVGKEDRKAVREMAEAYALSSNHSSDLVLAVGHGAVMFSHTAGLEGQVVQWLEHNLKALGTETEVSFRSEDGWTLPGKLRIPGGVNGSKVPGVVLVHGAKHDQQTYYELAQELAKEGMASLRFDWRGKGGSRAAGSDKYGMDVPDVNTEKAYLDVKAAIDFFSRQPGVDASRIGLIAATAGTDYALRAAFGDRRVQTVVVLTSASVPTGEAKEFLATSGKPIFAIASREDINYNRGSLADSTREAYLMSNSKESELLLYDDAGRGSEMFKVKPELERMVLRWFAEKLGAGKAANGRVEASQDRR